MAAPEYVPIRPTERPRTYASPPHVPESWKSKRPGDLNGRQPRAPQLGFPGPDQGFGLVLANRFRDRLHLTPGESADDAVTGCLGSGLRRASMFGRAPSVHDFTVAYTIWGFLDSSPPAELVDLRRAKFEGLAITLHHYAELRDLVDSIPEDTLRRSHQQVSADYPARWRDLLGLQ